MLSLTAALLPPRCGVCGRTGEALCRRCWGLLRPAPPTLPPVGVDRCRSLLVYDDVARALMVRIKYRNDRALVAWLAAGMARLVAGLAAEGSVTAVTWAPTSRARRRSRGYDQAELLARGVARHLAVPCRPTLVRLPGPAQTGRDRHARHQGPAFVVRRRRAPPPGVLLVDDVLTTGATLAAAAAVLRAGGAERLVALTAAATPLKVCAGRVDP